MAKPEPLVPIGHTRKAHGVHGELHVQVVPRYLEDLLQVEFIFLELPDGLVPFRVESVRMDRWPILKLEDVELRDEALPLTSRPLLLAEKDLIPDDQRQLEVDTLAFAWAEGYTLIDERLGRIGRIEEVREFPQQEMAIISYKKRELLVPLHQALISKVDEQQRQLWMRLPIGLIDEEE